MEYWQGQYERIIGGGYSYTERKKQLMAGILRAIQIAGEQRNDILILGWRLHPHPHPYDFHSDNSKWNLQAN